MLQGVGIISIWGICPPFDEIIMYPIISRAEIFFWSFVACYFIFVMIIN